MVVFSFIPGGCCNRGKEVNLSFLNISPNFIFHIMSVHNKIKIFHLDTFFRTTRPSKVIIDGSLKLLNTRTRRLCLLLGACHSQKYLLLDILDIYWVVAIDFDAFIQININ